MLREVRQAAGLCFASLAIFVQLAVATVIPASTVSLADATTLCHHDDGAPSPAAPTHPPPDCPICAVCQALTAPAALVASPPWVPVPRTAPIPRAAQTPPATAPPLRLVRAANPRAPPAFA